MNFYIDLDVREAISGWLTPDNPSVRSRFIIEIPDRPNVEFDANIFRPDILELGWHSTGHVGFTIDRNIIDDIDSIDDIRLIDYHTGITIYRRIPDDTYIHGRLVLFDCSLMPQWRLFSEIGKNFGLYYSAIDRFSLETTMALFWNHRANSSFICGSPNFLRYQHAIRSREFRIVALLRHPMEELAERLLFLRALAKSPGLSSIRSMFAAHEPLIAFAQELDIENRRALISAFRTLEERYKALLRSPMTRTFGTEITDVIERRKVSVALENLATLDFVGVRSRYGEFSTVLDGLMGRKMLSGSELSQIPGTTALAEQLMRIGPAVDLIEEDLALFAYADEAMVELGKETN